VELHVTVFVLLFRVNYCMFPLFYERKQWFYVLSSFCCFCDLLVPYGLWRTQEFCSKMGGVATNSFEDRGQRERGSGGGSPLVKVSGGCCNLVQEISFHIVKCS